MSRAPHRIRPSNPLGLAWVFALVVASMGFNGHVVETARADTVTVMDARLPTARDGTSAVWAEDAFFVFGGKGGDRLDEIVRYDPATDAVAVMAARLPSAREATAAVWTGEFAFILGGRETNRALSDEIVRYDPAADEITVMGATLPSGRELASAVWTGERILLMGGKESGARLDEILEYDPSTDTLKTLAATLPSARESAAAFWDGTYAYVAGGNDGARFDSIVRFDPATGDVTEMGATLPSARDGLSAVWDGEVAILFGGKNGPASDQILKYNPTTDEITVMEEKLPTARYLTSAAWDGSSAYVFGGRDADGALDEIVRYSLAPGAPQNLVASSGPGAGEVTLSWDPPDAATVFSSLTEYNIYRGTASGALSYHDTVSGDVSEYADDGLPAGVLFYYQVTAVNTGGEGPRSEEAAAASFTEAPPPLPTGLSGAGAVWTGDLVYIFGGNQTLSSGGGGSESYSFTPGDSEDDSAFTDDILVYDPINGTIETVSSLPDDRCCLEAVWDDEAGGAWLFGGIIERCCSSDMTTADSSGSALEEEESGTEKERSTEILFFDAATGVVRLVNETLPDRCCLEAVSDGENIWLFGDDRCCPADETPIASTVGTDAVPEEESDGESEVFIFYPANETLEDQGIELPGDRCCSAAAFTGDIMYLFGDLAEGDRCCDGMEDESDGGAEIIAFDPVSETVRVVNETLPGGRCCSDAEWNGLYIYLFGEEDDEDRCCQASTPGGGLEDMESGDSGSDGSDGSVLRFDPETETLTVTNSTLGDRCCMDTVWTGQSAYIVGGKADDTNVDTIEQFYPTAPQGLAAEAGPEPGEITLSWSSPEPGSPETVAYRIYAGDSPGTEEFVDEVDASTFTFTEDDLGNGTTRYYKVSARTENGESPQSNEDSARTFDAPSAPQNVDASPGPGDEEITVSWTPPADDGGLAITGYRVYAGNASGVLELATEVNGATYSWTETDLGDGTTRFYEVSAVNEIGEGPRSAEVSSSTWRLPTAPQNLEADEDLTTQEVHLTWQAPEDTGGGALLYYAIYRGTESGGEALYDTVPGSQTTYTDTECEILTPPNTCFYEVSLVTVAGEGPRSNEAQALGTDLPVDNPAKRAAPLSGSGPSQSTGAPEPVKASVSRLPTLLGAI